MKNRFVNFLYAIDCYLLYLLSGVLSACGVVAFYSVREALDIGYTGDADAVEFVDRVAGMVSDKSSVVMLASYVMIILFAAIVFAVRKRSITAYTGLSYARVKSMLGAVGVGVALSALTYSLFPEGATNGEEISLALVLCVLIGPFVEEFVFRGVLLKMFGASCGIFFSVIITSVLFALSHSEPAQMIYTFILGVVLCVIRISSTSLWSAVALHMSFNFSGLVLALGSAEISGKALAVFFILLVLSFAIASSGGRLSELKKK